MIGGGGCRVTLLGIGRYVLNVDSKDIVTWNLS